ncbi:MAG: hypothetical protein NUV59_03320 [Patescibacteria group bacterium]|nr:hypothetical protein [Patescibacteria group bacterium]
MLENRGKKRAQRRNVRKAVLAAVKAGVIIGVAMAAPNVIGAMKKIGISDFDFSDASTIARTRRQLSKAGLLVANANGRLRLTAKGQSELSRLQAKEMLRDRPRRWDGRWRILIFDIPEYRKSVRVKLRRTLISVGFMRLQDSVWIYPYDCEDFIVLLKADFRIGKDVLYMIVDELEGDMRVRDYFGLE